MALYNHTPRLFADGAVDLANLHVILTNGYVFDATETGLTAVNAAEVSGNGWPVGGAAITTPAVTTVTSNDAKLDGDDISITATGGDIGPADGLVVVDQTNNTPLKHFGFASKTAGDGTPFNVTWGTAGIITWTNAA